MKGYYIEVKNELLDPKHKAKMGSSVWEFMWFLDKITSISEEGRGLVLGGSPINLRDIQSEIGGGLSTISENLTRLEKENYIQIKRIPHGLIITVNKANKRFKQNSENRTTIRKSEGQFGKPNSNIRQYNDKTKTLTPLNSSPLKKYSSIKDITTIEIVDIAIKYKVSETFVKIQLEALINYCESNGKKYKNYKAALRNFVLRDMKGIVERQSNQKGGVLDATNL